MPVPIPERIQLLVDALRSGDYVQGRSRLTTLYVDGVEKDCCLGVACKIAMANGVRLQTLRQNPDYYTLGYVHYVESTGFHQSAMLPTAVEDFFGLYSGNPELIDPHTGESQTATYWNDGEKKTFYYIAELFKFTYIDHDGPTSAKAAVIDAALRKAKRNG